MTDTIIVMRCEEMPAPPLPSERHACSYCEAPVWVSQDSLRTSRGNDTMFICTVCYDPEPEMKDPSRRKLVASGGYKSLAEVHGTWTASLYMVANNIREVP